MDLDDLIHSIDILDYISQYTVFEKKGREYFALSPLKEEKTPSFSVDTDKQRFYCFASGLGGNVYTFIRLYNHCSPREAIEIMKGYIGYNGEVIVPHEKLEATKICKKYSKSDRNKDISCPNILPDNYMSKYETRRDKLDVWRNEGICDEALEKYGVRYDPYANRLVYPILNLDNRIVNVGGRTLEENWKEMGLRKYTYYQKWGGCMNIVYGIAQNMDDILAKKEVILFEGCKSVMIAYGWGIKNTGAILTSHLSPEQMKILAKLGCRVVFALDKEIDVSKDHNVSRLKNYVNVETINDVNDLLEPKDAPVDNGEEVFRKLYEQRIRIR